MATIRTQLVDGDRRIITKVVNGQRRVSCSCCEVEVECCMYPADQLGVGYTIEDLPDKIIGEGGEFTKNNPPIPFTPDPSVLIYYGFAGEGVGIADGEEVWRQFVDFGGTDGARCLIGNIGGSSFIDDFADTYAVSSNLPQLASATVVRTSLCQWEGIAVYTITDANVTVDIPVILVYSSNPVDEDYLKWKIEANRGFAIIGKGSGTPKDGTQNTPVGNYPWELGDSDTPDINNIVWTVS
jgi:hypothetical protein